MRIEARELARVAFKYTRWFRRVRRERRQELEDMRRLADRHNWSLVTFRRAWLSYLRAKYRDNGWLLADGSPDVWRMFRSMRARAIKLGEWEETPYPRGSHRRRVTTPSGGLVRIDKGRAREQASRYRERLRLARAGA